VFATYAYLAPVRVPASDMLHVFRPIAPGQVRGIPWTAPDLPRLRELDQFEDAVATGQKIAAMFCGFLTDTGASGATPLFDGAQAGSVLESGLEPGTLKVLPAGVDIKFSTPREAAEAVSFMQLQLRSIAAGIGVPEYLLTGDLSHANYSSLRAALIEFRRRIEAIQFHTVIHQFCRPVWERFVTLGVLSGAILAADDFELRAADYLACAWQPPGFDWVDPLKDVQSDAIAVSQGFKSRGQVVRERGLDAEQVDAEIAADRDRANALGLTFPNVAAATITPKQEADANAS
jgi:lambda family phage portal protein